MCGTVKSRIRGTPRAYQLKQKEQPRGAMIQATTEFIGVDIYYTSCQDSKVVNINLSMCSRDDLVKKKVVFAKDLISVIFSEIAEYTV